MFIKLIIVITILAIYASRFRISVIQRMKESGGWDKKLIVLEGLILTLILFQLTGFNFGNLSDQSWAPYAGIFLLISGLFISVYARIKLGTSYMPAIAAKAPENLVTSGPFRIVRHPIYLGGIIGILGLELALNSPLIFVMLVLAPFIMVLQIDKEESLLSLKHRQSWLNYKLKTPYKVIPFIY